VRTQALRHQHQAFCAFFAKRARYPRFKSRRTRHDRDINAATNILAAGQAVTACGADVRHPGTSRAQSAVKQEPRPVTARIPALEGRE
jgi:hypothetical protein